MPCRQLACSRSSNHSMLATPPAKRAPGFARGGRPWPDGSGQPGEARGLGGALGEDQQDRVLLLEDDAVRALERVEDDVLLALQRRVAVVARRVQRPHD